MATSNSGSIKGRMRVAALALAIVGLATVSMPVPGEAGDKAKPKAKAKLRVKELTFDGSPSTKIPTVVLEPNGKGKFAITYRIENSGKETSDDTEATIYISDKKAATQQVGPIGEDRSQEFRLTSKEYTKHLHPGLHDATVCLGKHCAHPVEFWAVPKRWKINTFSTTRPAGRISDPLTRTDAQVAFTFYGAVGTTADPFFQWVATGGLVTTEIHGDGGPCTLTGHGVQGHTPWEVAPPDLGGLAISATDGDGPDLYSAVIQDEDYRFLVQRACPGADTEEFENEMGRLMTSCPGPTTSECPMSWDDKALAGKVVDDPVLGSTTWSFTPDLPHGHSRTLGKLPRNRRMR